MKHLTESKAILEYSKIRYMKKPVEVKEYDTIVGTASVADSGRFTCIDDAEFAELLRFAKEYTAAENEADALEFMKIGFQRSVGDMITMKNYVGLIQLKNGYQIQILPKVFFYGDEDNGNERTKRVFLKMLRSMKDFPGRVFNEATLMTDRMNLYELFINMYLQETHQLVKHGIRSSYVDKEENQRFYKGKLLVNQHIRANLVHKERFFVSYEEFHPNRPENRLIKSTLLKLLKVTASAQNAKEIRQLLTAFELVEPSVNYEKDFAKVVIDRNTKDYDVLIKWSRVFLMNKSFTTFSGTTNSRALLFPMESVYESYVARQLKKSFVQDGWYVSNQDRGHYLFTEPRRQFALRPDIVMKRDGRTIILDTKWKNLINNANRNYGITQADMYQMYAYSKKYETSEVWLLYPENKDMYRHAPIDFDSGDGTRVHVHFVDLEHIEENMDQLKARMAF